MPQRGEMGTEGAEFRLWVMTALVRLFLDFGVCPSHPTPRGASPRKSPQRVHTSLQAFPHTFPPLPCCTASSPVEGCLE